MRDNSWLFQKLDEIWDNHFSDIPQENDVTILFGRKARNRLGSIKKDPKGRSVITINGLFKDPTVPDYVIELVIAHELCHYAHGFNSPLEQRFSHPHKGGVVTRELKTRGLDEKHRLQKKWLKVNWEGYQAEKLGARKIRRRRVIIRWI